MAQITLTLDLTLENVEALRKLAIAIGGQGKGFDGMEQIDLDDVPAAPEKPAAKTPAGKAKTGTTKKETPPAETSAGDKAIDLTDVRAVALKLSQSGKQATLQAIFAKFGAKKLSDVPQDDYPALMEELEAAVNG